MRFSLALSSITLLTSVLGHANLQSTRSQPISPRLSSLEQRQVDLNVCVTLPANVGVSLQPLGIPVRLGVTEGLCLCVANGVLTPAALERLTADVTNNLNLDVDLGGLEVVVVLPLVVNAVLTLIGAQPAPVEPCPYPPGAIPNSCSACTFDCPATAPNLCNGQCTTAACPSGIPRRAIRSINADLLCPSGLTACSSSNAFASAWGKVDCLDTLNNVEACGGCRFPLPGQKSGVDCSALANTDSVSCVAGRCSVGSCLDGFVLVGGACEEA